MPDFVHRSPGDPVNNGGSVWGNLALKFPGGHMAEVASHNNGHRQGAQSVELRVAATLENLAVLRTLVAAVGTFEDLDFDAVADLRLAVDEACTRLIRSAVPGRHPGARGAIRGRRSRRGRRVDHLRQPPTSWRRAASAGTC